MAVLNNRFSNIKKIVWALDALDESSTLHQRSATLIAQLAQRGVQVQPVYLLTPSRLNLPLELSGPWMEQYIPAAENAIQQKLQKFLSKDILPVKVITEVASSTTHSVDHLSRYAVQIGADMILTATHGRSGWRRFLLGSFTESLMTRSELPVLVVGPKSQRFSLPTNILFASDLMSESKEVYRHVIGLAKFFKCQITLLHIVPQSVEPVFQSGVYLLGGGWIPLERPFGEEFHRQERRAQAWAKWGSDQGVRVIAEVSMGARSVSDSIIKTAKNFQVSLIALEAQSGAFSAALLGSIARQTIRHAPCPVWTLPAKALAVMAPHSIKGRETGIAA